MLGGRWGLLGNKSELVPVDSEQAVQNYDLGKITIKGIDVDNPCDAIKFYRCQVRMWIHCFAAEDVSTDEFYAIASLIAVNPTNAGNLSHTMRTPIVDTQSHDNPVEGYDLGVVPLVGSGIRVYVCMWDKESGDPDEVRDKIAAVIEDAANKAAKAIAGGAIEDDPSVTGGTVGDITEFEVGGVKPFHIITLKLAEVIAQGLSDDLIGEKFFDIPISNLIQFGNPQFYQSSTRQEPGFPFDAQINWPPHANEPEPFTKGGALYRAVFQISVTEDPTPCPPPLK